GSRPAGLGSEALPGRGPGRSGDHAEPPPVRRRRQGALRAVRGGAQRDVPPPLRGRGPVRRRRLDHPGRGGRPVLGRGAAGALPLPRRVQRDGGRPGVPAGHGAADPGAERSGPAGHVRLV
ncbi:MAG: hypothetical protein AVDCRST_MAG57-401, partial [uncultured Blastococcus sp.]